MLRWWPSRSPSAARLACCEASPRAPMSRRPPTSSSPCTPPGRAWPATSRMPPRGSPSAAPLRSSRSTPAAARSRCGCRTPPGTPAARWSAWPPAWACGTRRAAATCCRRPRPTRRTRAAPEPPSARPPSSTSPFATTSGGTNCPGQYQGVLQPYAIYVPSGPMPRQGYGMTLLLHSLSTNYNQYLGSRNQSQFGDRAGGSIVITPESRGPDGFYDSYAGADVFEVWADVARRYRLDPEWSAITGYSMGGLGTFKLAEQFPDLFAKAQPTVGFSGDNNLVPSLRNIPFLMWNSLIDELVPPTDYLPTAAKFDGLGYRYELDVFTPADHLTLAINDQFAPAAAFLDLAKVNRNPAHVTYVVDPTLDYPGLGFVADHAYWLSGIELRSSTPPVTGGHTEGSIDALSYGFGVGDPTPSATQFGAGTLTGGNRPPPPAYTRQYRTWGPVPSIPRAKRIDLTARNIAAVTINVQRASVGCGVDVHVDTDGPMTIELAGCRRTVTAGGGA